MIDRASVARRDGVCEHATQSASFSCTLTICKTDFAVAVHAEAMVQNVALMRCNVRSSQQEYTILLIERVVKLLCHRVEGTTRILAEKNERFLRPAKRA